MHTNRRGANLSKYMSGADKIIYLGLSYENQAVKRTPQT